MSYSFSVKAATKAELGEKIQEELAKVAASQPIHQADTGQALNTAWSIFSLLQDDQARDITASVSGSISKNDAGFQSVSLSLNFGLVTREHA